MKNENWDDLRLFFHVAREGGLSGAAARTGISAPTIGRRMLALERATGRSLFVRSPTGYVLAPDGEVLFERVRGMQLVAEDINAWQEEVFTLPIVATMADSWIMHFLTRRMDAIWTPEDDFRMCLKTHDAPMDLTYRDANIAISDHRPQIGNVAAMPAGTMGFAAYCARPFDQERNCNWISLATEGATTASARWVFQQTGLWITLWTNTPRNLLDLVRSGAGRGILPCFIGDHDPRLVRIGPVLPELEREIWITMHDDERQRPEVRRVIDRLRDLFNRDSALFAGEVGDA